MGEARQPITGMTLPQLTELLESRTRALAALRWLYGSSGGPPRAPEAIRGVGAQAHRRLWEACELRRAPVTACQESPDGTVKLALDLSGAAAEVVLIPARGRSTACVSSQAGCSRRCAFCATARLGLSRNLAAAEIVEQFLAAREVAPPGSPLRNVVFMGMGEPMDNLDAVLSAIEILTQPPAPRLGAEHITVSTSGVLPGMRRFFAESRANLALSLNATTDAQREALMPQNRLWPIAELIGALREDARARRRLYFIEFVLFDGVNDSPEDAHRLLGLLQGVPARVNLIPHNPFDGSPLRPPPPQRIAQFQSIVHTGGVRCLLRSSRGREIDAACGQLALKASAAA